MPTATIRARTKPYPERPRSNERLCARCGIKYRFRPDRENWTECRDCRDVEGNHSRPERAYNPRTTAPFNPAKCGTTAGFYQHKAHGIDVCLPCLEANRKYNRERKRSKAKNGPRPPKPSVCGTPAGWSRHRRAGTQPCGPCDEAQRKYERDYYHTKRKIAAMSPCARGCCWTPTLCGRQRDYPCHWEERKPSGQTGTAASHSDPTAHQAIRNVDNERRKKK